MYHGIYNAIQTLSTDKPIKDQGDFAQPLMLHTLIHAVIEIHNPHQNAELVDSSFP